MNIKSILNLKRYKTPNTATLYLMAIVLGLLSGFSHFALLQNIGFLISDIFIKIFKCISLPIIALSLIVTLSQIGSDQRSKAIWKKTLFYTIGTTIIAAIVTCALYLIISPANIANIAVDATETQNIFAQSTYLSSLINIIPSNIFAPFLEHKVMGALLVSILFGVAIRYIPDERSRHAIIHFFGGVHGIFLVITTWIVKIIPLALFGFITTAVVQLKSGFDISSLGEYLLVVILANMVQGFIILPLFLFLNKIKPFHTFKGMLPALSVAFFSKSSAGTLPVTMETIEKNLNVSPKISRLILPLCTSINMNGCAAFIFATVIYVMQNNGLDVGLSAMILWIFIATIAAIGNAGVPMGCFFLSASLLTSMNVPITLLAFILPLYSLIDMIETALNVWSDSCVTCVINKHEQDAKNSHSTSVAF